MLSTPRRGPPVVVCALDADSYIIYDNYSMAAGRRRNVPMMGGVGYIRF